MLHRKLLPPRREVSGVLRFRCRFAHVYLLYGYTAFLYQNSTRFTFYIINLQNLFKIFLPLSIRIFDMHNIITGINFNFEVGLQSDVYSKLGAFIYRFLPRYSSNRYYNKNKT